MRRALPAIRDHHVFYAYKLLTGSGSCGISMNWLPSRCNGAVDRLAGSSFVELG